MTREELIEVMARAILQDFEDGADMSTHPVPCSPPAPTLHPKADMTPADIERAAQALAEHRDAGGIPWPDKMEIARENWREAVRVVIEALATQS
jgi:hypothetical protein